MPRFACYQVRRRRAPSGTVRRPLTPWQRLGILAAWAAGALLADGILLARRDA
ncbi:MAG TPA: hypothetical protein VF162_18425 [Streptosporangiaceae bacterium]